MRKRELRFGSKEMVGGKEVQIIKPSRASKGWGSCGRQWYVKSNENIYMIIGFAGRFRVYRYNEEVAAAKKGMASAIGMEQHLIAEFKQLQQAIESVAKGA
jgi:hypothetical protein